MNIKQKILKTIKNVFREPALLYTGEENNWLAGYII